MPAYIACDLMPDFPPAADLDLCHRPARPGSPTCSPAHQAIREHGQRLAAQGPEAWVERLELAMRFASSPGISDR